MSQEQLLEKIRNNPGIEQCRIINPKTSHNSRMLKALLRKGMIRREIKNNKYCLYPARNKTNPYCIGCGTVPCPTQDVKENLLPGLKITSCSDWSAK